MSTGPEFWGTLAGGEICDGDVQSPINIDTDSVISANFGIFEVDGYNDMTMTGTEVHNNGHTSKFIQKKLEKSNERKINWNGF